MREVMIKLTIRRKRGNEFHIFQLKPGLICEEDRMAEFRTYVNEPRRKVIWEQEQDKNESGGAVMLVMLLLILAVGTVYFLWEASNAEARANEAALSAHARTVAVAADLPAAR